MPDKRVWKMWEARAADGDYAIGWHEWDKRISYFREPAATFVRLGDEVWSEMQTERVAKFEVTGVFPIEDLPGYSLVQLSDIGYVSGDESEG